MKAEEKRVVGFKQAVIVMMTAILLASSTVVTDTSAASKFRWSSSAPTPEQNRSQRESKKRKADGSGDKSIAGARAILWREPRDIARRDLFYGSGGRQGAPDPASKFTFVRHSESGTQMKIIVRDDRGREWTVKFGPEARPETAATRIIWAAGYHVDQTYFVRRAQIVGKEQYDARDVRFERRDDGFEEVGNWKWKESPFEETREMDGLKVLMALIKNWDLKSSNNKILRPKRNGDSALRIYYVSDVGASFGQTGTWLNRIPFLWDLPAEKGFAAGKAKGNPEAFTEEEFIKEVDDGEVAFYSRRSRMRSRLKGVSVENARWMGNLLARLSDKQLADAFRAGGFNEAETALYVRTTRDRIRQLQQLNESRLARR
jgi:hypothetical protein